MKKIRTAVMGCTGIVGQQFIRMLDSHPYFEVVALTSSEKSAGKKYIDISDWRVNGYLPQYVREMTVEKTSVEILKKKEVSVVFSALPSEVAKHTEKSLAQEGMFVFSNAGAHRYDPDVPILIPEVNAPHLQLVKTQTKNNGGFIVTNSNCSTTGLVMVLGPLKNFGIKWVGVTTYQALSGAGLRGVSSLEILGNVIPYIKEEEEKMEKETSQILGRLNKGVLEEEPIEVNASCSRVPVKEGHLESVIVELEEDVHSEAVLESLKLFRGIPQEMKLPTAPETPLMVKTERDRPQPVMDVNAGTPERAKGMTVTVGRIRKRRRRINLFLLVHNTVRGAAGTCILNAELALNKGFFT